MTQATEGSPLHAPPMPRMAETESWQSHPIVRRRACQDSFRERTGDSAQTEDIICEIPSTYGEGASATKSDVWGACWGQGLLRGAGEGPGGSSEEDGMSVIGMKLKGWRKDAQ